MKQSAFILTKIRPLAPGISELTLEGDTSDFTAPGQFVNIALPGKFLRRPVSVCDWTDGKLILIVKEAGHGTAELLHSPSGTKLDLLTGLGNGFILPENIPPERMILAGGGIGLAPLYALAKAIKNKGGKPAAALGFRNGSDAFYLEEFANLGCEVIPAAEDGAFGSRKLVTDILQAYPERTYVFSCGPMPMLRAVHTLPHLTGGQFSFEARMGCGFGACMGCSIPVKNGSRRVCREGPVFSMEEIVWRTWQ